VRSWTLRLDHWGVHLEHRDYLPDGPGTPSGGGRGGSVWLAPYVWQSGGGGRTRPTCRSVGNGSIARMMPSIKAFGASNVES